MSIIVKRPIFSVGSGQTKYKSNLERVNIILQARGMNRQKLADELGLNVQIVNRCLNSGEFQNCRKAIESWIKENEDTI